MNNVVTETSSDNNLIKIFKGLMCSFIITLISIFIFSAILTYTNISEKIIPIVIIILTFISILIGSMLSTKSISKNGMMNGAIIGGTYVILLYLISSLLNTGFALNIYTIVMIIAGIISGIIGGILGVNT